MGSSATLTNVPPTITSHPQPYCKHQEYKRATSIVTAVDSCFTLCLVAQMQRSVLSSCVPFASMQAAAAVFAFRGTKLNKGKTLRADLQLVMDSDLDLHITQRALRKVKNHMRRLTSQQPDIHWGFFATGHSLGGPCRLTYTSM